MPTPYIFSSHESFTHDSIDSLAYDWERIANPEIAAKHPFLVYFPKTTEDVARAVRDTNTLGDSLIVRANGHSSNDLVTKDGGVVLCTTYLDRVLEVDPLRETVTVQPGIPLARVDDHLRSYKLGLPVIGDHNHVTAGGFASVGGISPASHRFGMFVDNVLEVEIVTPEGQVETASRADQPKRLYAVLGGLGRHGIITKLKIRVYKVDKWSETLRNDLRLFTDMQSFLKTSGEGIRNPGEALMERGLWVDIPLGERFLRVGQFSAYHATKQSSYAKLREKLEYGYLHTIGWVAGRLPTDQLELAAKYLGIAGIVLSPRYATIKDIETFTDRVIDESTGDPTRMFIALAPQDQYETLFRALYSVCLSYRAREKCFTFVSIYVKAIDSPFLGNLDGKKHCELMLFLGLDRERFKPDVLEAFVSEVDDLCIAHGAYRYMHSRTVKDAARRARIDPNEVRRLRDGAQSMAAHAQQLIAEE